MRSKVLPVAMLAAMLAVACGGAPSAYQAPKNRATHTGMDGVDQSQSAGGVTGAVATATPSGQGGAAPSGAAVPSPGTASAGPSRSRASANSTPSSGGTPGGTSAPSAPPGTGSCPDPRYCGDYFLDPGSPSWPKNTAGVATVHYRINPSHPGTPTQLTDSQVIAVVQQLAKVWMAADPSVDLVYDGTTTDQPVNSNNVVGFTAAAGNAAVNIPMTFSSDQKTITGFNIQFAPQVPWSWEPCDGSSTPCKPYPGNGLDIGASAAHAWGHVLGLDDLAASQDQYLSDFGGIGGAYPDCGGNTTGMVCRFAVTLGLGDVLGARHLYPTSAPMPTLYFDT